jgi:catechol 2,3-dioxygenase-like lactoylglutathione lyase family enzyme
MSRVQLALNVADLDTSIAFYAKLFNTQPAKVRPGYANFAIADPPLKLVLFADTGTPGTLNHLGVEVETTEHVAAAVANAADHQLAATVQDNTTCCFAVQDKVWIDGPDNAWEFYTVLAAAPILESDDCCVTSDSGCCVKTG